MTHDLLLGLIGDSIAQSRSPLLHRLAGAQNGLAVRYDRLVPTDMGLGFDAVFDRCAASGYRGVNVTYPYKERVTARLTIRDPLVRAIGAVNTVLFGDGAPEGHNTDHSGFIAAYRAARGQAGPGAVCLIGTGGVGRAIAFALLALGAREIRLVDRDPARAAALAADLRASGAEGVAQYPDAETAARGAAGLINCTPVGMGGQGGTALPAHAMPGADWAFDAVYTPTDTRFLGDAAEAGLSVIPGWELFFWQGVHAWSLFSGMAVDRDRLRRDLLAAPAEAAT